MKKPEMRLLEREVTRQIKDYLEWNGWRAFRNQVMTSQNHAGGWVSAGEKGQPDFLFLYYFRPGLAPMGGCMHLWVELKRKGEPLRPDQVEWHFKEIKRNALVIVVDDFEEFRTWYEEHFAWLGQEGQQQQLPLLGSGMTL